MRKKLKDLHSTTLSWKDEIELSNRQTYGPGHTITELELSEDGATSRVAAQSRLSASSI
jgi:hypothetical protein